MTTAVSARRDSGARATGDVLFITPMLEDLRVTPWQADGPVRPTGPRCTGPPACPVAPAPEPCRGRPRVPPSVAGDHHQTGADTHDTDLDHRRGRLHRLEPRPAGARQPGGDRRGRARRPLDRRP